MRNHPRAAVIIIFGAVVLLWCFAGLLNPRKHHRPEGFSTLRNKPELLLAVGAAADSRRLPEIPDWKTNFSPADLAFGREQVARMVKDRPHMTDCVSETNAIYEFCVLGFAGASIGEPIVWDNTLPDDSECHAEHMRPYAGKKGFIRVRNAQGAGQFKASPLSCEEMWACVVFELENIRSWRADDELYRLALAGELTREEWVRDSSLFEYVALRRTAADWKLLWVPLARTRHLPTTATYWGLNVPPTYEAWISAYSDPNGYPWTPFGRYYDEQVIPYLRSARIQLKPGK